ncbi:hypothetical protein KQY10_00170, partial [Leptospira interrogans]|nr:hypothetical protein [Leptospira interrogans]
GTSDSALGVHSGKDKTHTAVSHLDASNFQFSEPAKIGHVLIQNCKQTVADSTTKHMRGSKG